MICIYKITSPSNKIYIGQTSNYKRRLYEYSSSSSCKKQRKIFNSINKYGIESHKFEPIYIFSNDVNQQIIDYNEIIYYNYYKCIGFSMLNLREPGKGGKLTEVAKDKIRANRIGKKHSEETKEKMKLSRLGRKFSSHSEQAKLNMSVAAFKRNKNKINVNKL